MASDQIDALIDKRAEAAGRANAEEDLWKASVRKHEAKLRRQHRAEWYEFYSRLAESHACISEHFEEKARALLEDENTNGRRIA